MAEPDPLHDDTGFPVVLLRARQVARGRGGDIVADRQAADGAGARESWVVVHPDPAVPSFVVSFFPDGVAGVYFDGHSGVDNGPDKSYEPGQNGLTHLERLVIAVINGHYRETIGYDKDWQEVRADSVIEGDDVTDVGGYGFSEDSVHETEYRYPAWPESV